MKESAAVFHSLSAAVVQKSTVLVLRWPQPKSVHQHAANPEVHIAMVQIRLCGLTGT